MSLLTSFTRSTPGGEQFDIIEPVDARCFAGAVAVATANLAYLSRFRLSKAATISAVSYFVGTASGNVDVGVYEFDGTNYVRLGSSGSTAASGSSAVQTINLTASVNLRPGKDYWLALAADNGTITILRQGGTVVLAFGNRTLFKSSLSPFALPATISSPSTTSTTVPWLAAS